MRALKVEIHRSQVSMALTSKPTSEEHPKISTYYLFCSIVTYTLYVIYALWYTQRRRIKHSTFIRQLARPLTALFEVTARSWG